VVAVTLALILGGTGIADAANGQPFLLGHANSETAQATLSNSNGTPLSLSAPANKAPLTVNRKALVSNLNAQYVGGLTAPQLQTAGGDGFTAAKADVVLNNFDQIVAKTGPLPAGTYYVTATAGVFVAADDTPAFCGIVKGSAPGTVLQDSLADGNNTWASLAETVAAKVAAGDTLEEDCSVAGDNSTGVAFARDAAITAIRVATSSGTPPA
jgi:hypothetical protein